MSEPRTSLQLMPLNTRPIPRFDPVEEASITRAFETPEFIQRAKEIIEFHRGQTYTSFPKGWTHDN